MINLINEQLEDIPVLHVVRSELHEKGLPTVIYYHGYQGEKISSLTLAYKIAEKGYRVILPDCLYHGERKAGLSETELSLAFWDVVTQTIEELPQLRHALVERGYTEANQIGIGGTSMGGIITYGALASYDWISSAAVLMGTPYMTHYAMNLIDYFNQNNEEQIPQEKIEAVKKQLAPYDLSTQQTKLNGRPLLIWHGELDKLVPYDYSPKFHAAISGDYQADGTLKFVSEKEHGHHISRLSIREAAA